MNGENMIFSIMQHMGNIAMPAFFGGVLADVFVPQTFMPSTNAIIIGMLAGAILFLFYKAIFSSDQVEEPNN